MAVPGHVLETPSGKRGWRDVAVLGLPAALGAGAVALPTSLHAATPTNPPHVMVIMEENKGYAATLGTCSADPYLCSLGAQYASVVGWVGIGHPSEPTYLAITTGGTQGCTSDTCFATLKVPSLGGQLSAAGIPWTAYMESMHSACYTKQWAGGTGSSALYGGKHDPFVVEGDVLNNGCTTHVLPYPGVSAMVNALNGSSAPAFVWITPNQLDDMHSASVTAGDNWLKTNLAPVLSSSWFTAFNSTVVVTMDEGPNAANQIPLVVISNNAKGQGNVTLAGNHYGTLRSIEEAYQLPLLAAAGNASNGDVSGLFGAPTIIPTPTPSPTASPTPGPTPTPSPTLSGLICPLTTVTAATIQAAVASCVGGTITLPAGTFDLTNHVAVNQPVTISGAGETATFLIQ